MGPLIVPEDAWPKHGSALVQQHQSSSPDEMPVYFGWYEVAPDKDKKTIEIREYPASLDSGDEGQMLMRLKIDNFGPPGTIVRGSFSGKLFDEEGLLRSSRAGNRGFWMELCLANPEKVLEDPRSEWSAAS